MSERKVINKYIPPDFNPDKVPRVKRKNKQKDVRIMAPFNMKCNTCGNSIGAGTKFNAKKETIEDETYNKLLIYRFYIKCTRCMQPIVYRTNLKEASYEVEHGAKECFMALKLAEKQAREEAQADEEEEKINPMKQLESRTKASRQQMEASEQIQQLRSIKYKMHTVDLDAIIEDKKREAREEAQSTAAICDKADEEIRAEAKQLLLKRKVAAKEDASASSSGLGLSSLPHRKPAESKLSASLSSLKKKIKVTPKAT